MVEIWNTWEELLLGGAVLRHGTQRWHIVASELQTQIPNCVFTPQVCKAKYEDLKERYSGRTTWFEELRKKRVAELKRSLELSENSIGFLESKIKSLEAETNKKERDNSSYFTEETISAGSFTHEISENFSPEVAGSCDEEYEKTSNAADMSAYYFSANIGQLRWSNMKKRRSKRKRKDYSRDYGSRFENADSSSLALGIPTKNNKRVEDKEFLSDTSDDDHVVVAGCEEFSSSRNCKDQSLNDDEMENFLAILESIMENKVASVFLHRLYSQKRRRYEKMIRRHMDLETIRYRIITKAIKSRMELFVDLLVVTNNALVFFPNTTREYKSALILRDLVTLKLSNLQHFAIKSSSQKDIMNASPSSVIIRPGNRRIVASKTADHKFPCKLTCNSSFIEKANKRARVTCN